MDTEPYLCKIWGLKYLKNKIWFWSWQIQIQQVSYFLYLDCFAKYAIVQNTKKNWFYHINLSQKSNFILQISQLQKILQNWFCIQNLCMDLIFQEKTTVCKSVTRLKNQNNFPDTGEFRRSFWNTLYKWLKWIIQDLTGLNTTIQGLTHSFFFLFCENLTDLVTDWGTLLDLERLLPLKLKYKIFDIVQKGGEVSGEAKLFNKSMYGHVVGGWGGRGLRSSSKTVFYKKKVCFWDLWTVSLL